MIPLSEFPAIDAALNAASALLLALGYFFIRRRRIQAHKVCMLSAFGTSSLFLACYIWYHAHHGVTRFAGRGAVRDLASRASRACRGFQSGHDCYKRVHAAQW